MLPVVWLDLTCSCHDGHNLQTYTEEHNGDSGVSGYLVSNHPCHGPSMRQQAIKKQHVHCNEYVTLVRTSPMSQPGAGGRPDIRTWPRTVTIVARLVITARACMWTGWRVSVCAILEGHDCCCVVPEAGVSPCTHGYVSAPTHALTLHGHIQQQTTYSLTLHGHIQNDHIHGDHSRPVQHMAAQTRQISEGSAHAGVSRKHWNPLQQMHAN